MGETKRQAEALTEEGSNDLVDTFNAAAQDLQDTVDELTGDMGAPGGFATLGDDGELSNDQIPTDITAADLDFDPATQTELDGHVNDTSNPHSVDKTDVGLGDVPNTYAAHAYFVDVDSANTTTYTVSASDFGQILHVDTSSADVTIELPAGLTAGRQLEIKNTGSGKVTLSSTASSTLHAPDGKTAITKQYGGVTVRHKASDVWYAEGRLA